MMPFVLPGLSTGEATCSNAASSSCAAEEVRPRVLSTSHAVGQPTAGQSENGALSGAEAAVCTTGSTGCSGKVETARGANSVKSCKDDGHAQCKDEVEMVEVRDSTQLARSCAPADDNSNGLFDSGDQDYRRPAHHFSKDMRHSASHASDRSTHHASMGQHDVNSLSKKDCDQISAVVDMSCLNDAEVGGTESEELRHNLTSRNSAVRLLDFDTEGSTKESAPGKECSEIALKLPSRPAEASAFPFMLQTPSGGALAKMMLVHTLMNGKTETGVSTAKSAIRRNLLFDDQVDQKTESALARRRRECKLKFLKRQLQSSPAKVATADELPGDVDNRDISYLVDFVEGREHTVEASKVSNGNCSAIKCDKKKEKRKKTAASCSAELIPLEESSAMSEPSSSLSSAAHLEPTQADNVAADRIVMNGVPATGFDEAFLTVDRKKKTAKPAVTCPWSARPAASSLPTSSALRSVTFGVEHPSLRLPPADRAYDSSSCTDDVQSKADDEAYPSLVRLPPVSGAAVSGFSYDISTTSSPEAASSSSETASCTSQVLGKDKPPKESWAAVAARGLLGRGHGISSTPVTTGNLSVGMHVADSTTSRGRSGAAFGLPCGLGIASAPTVSQHAAAVKVYNSTYSLAEELSRKGLEFVGMQRKLFLSMSSSKIPLSFIESDGEDMLLCTADEAASYKAGPEPAGGSGPAGAPSGGLDTLQTPLVEGHAASGLVPAGILSGGLDTDQICLLEQQNGTTVDGPALEDNFDVTHIESVHHLIKEWLQVQELLIRGHGRVICYQPDERAVKSGPQAEV